MMNLNPFLLETPSCFVQVTTLTNCHKFVKFPLRWNNAKLYLYTDLERSNRNVLWVGIAQSVKRLATG